MENLVPVYTMYRVFPCWQKKKEKKKLKKKWQNKNCITAPIFKPTDDQKLETFCWPYVFLQNCLGVPGYPKISNFGYPIPEITENAQP